MQRDQDPSATGDAVPPNDETLDPAHMSRKGNKPGRAPARDGETASPDEGVLTPDKLPPG